MLPNLLCYSCIMCLRELYFLIGFIFWTVSGCLASITVLWVLKWLIWSKLDTDTKQLSGSGGISLENEWGTFWGGTLLQTSVPQEVQGCLMSCCVGCWGGCAFPWLLLLGPCASYQSDAASSRKILLDCVIPARRESNKPRMMLYLFKRTWASNSFMII